MMQSHAESMKEILGAIQKLPAIEHSQFSHNLGNWAELAVLVSWQLLKGSQDFLHTFSMALYHKWDVKNGFAYVLTFFSLISDGLGSVKYTLQWGQGTGTNWSFGLFCQSSYKSNLSQVTMVVIFWILLQRILSIFGKISNLMVHTRLSS